MDRRDDLILAVAVVALVVEWALVLGLCGDTDWRRLAFFVGLR